MEPFANIALDLFELADYQGFVAIFLNIVCRSSGFQLCTMIESRHPGHAFEEFWRQWLTPFGIPKKLLSDSGGELHGEFAAEVESMNIDHRFTPGEAPTQNATAERHGGNWKFVAKGLIDDYSISFKERARVFWLQACCNWACNSQVNDTGYSPAQWALGRGVRLPYAVLGQSQKLAFLDRVAEDTSFAERLALMSGAQRAFAQMRHSSALARAFRSRARGAASYPSDVLFHVGDRVYYWRGKALKKSDWSNRWIGPATVVGREGNSLWLSHRNRTIKAAAIHVRLATKEETLLSPGEFERLMNWYNADTDKNADGNPVDDNMPQPVNEVPAFPGQAAPALIPITST